MPCITKQEADVKRRKLSGIVNIIPKIESATNLIKKAISEQPNCIVTFSGGKDSLITLTLARRIKPDITALFSNTGNEYKETVPYVRSFSNVVEVVPKKSFWQCVKEYGLPENKRTGKRHGSACCFWLKEKPLDTYHKENGVTCVITGLTSEESRQRMMTLKRMGNYYQKKSNGVWYLHPIYNWTSQDVWDFINFYKIPYNPIYDMGIPRCGCRFCTAYHTWKDITALYNEKDTQLLMKKQGFKLLREF